MSGRPEGEGGDELTRTLPTRPSTTNRLPRRLQSSSHRRRPRRTLHGRRRLRRRILRSGNQRGVGGRKNSGGRRRGGFRPLGRSESQTSMIIFRPGHRRHRYRHRHRGARRRMRRRGRLFRCRRAGMLDSSSSLVSAAVVGAVPPVVGGGEKLRTLMIGDDDPLKETLLSRGVDEEGRLDLSNTSLRNRDCTHLCDILSGDNSLRRSILELVLENCNLDGLSFSRIIRCLKADADIPRKLFVAKNRGLLLAFAERFLKGSNLVVVTEPVPQEFVVDQRMVDAAKKAMEKIQRDIVAQIEAKVLLRERLDEAKKHLEMNTRTRDALWAKEKENAQLSEEQQAELSRLAACIKVAKEEMKGLILEKRTIENRIENLKSERERLSCEVTNLHLPDLKPVVLSEEERSDLEHTFTGEELDSELREARERIRKRNRTTQERIERVQDNISLVNSEVVRSEEMQVVVEASIGEKKEEIDEMKVERQDVRDKATFPPGVQSRYRRVAKIARFLGGLVRDLDRSVQKKAKEEARLLNQSQEHQKKESSQTGLQRFWDQLKAIDSRDEAQEQVEAGELLRLKQDGARFLEVTLRCKQRANQAVLDAKEAAERAFHAQENTIRQSLQIAETDHVGTARFSLSECESARARVSRCVVKVTERAERVNESVGLAQANRYLDELKNLMQRSKSLSDSAVECCHQTNTALSAALRRKEERELALAKAQKIVRERMAERDASLLRTRECVSAALESLSSIPEDELGDFEVFSELNVFAERTKEAGRRFWKGQLMVLSAQQEFDLSLTGVLELQKSQQAAMKVSEALQSLMEILREVESFSSKCENAKQEATRRRLHAFQTIESDARLEGEKVTAAFHRVLRSVKMARDVIARLVVVAVKLPKEEGDAFLLTAMEASKRAGELLPLIKSRFRSHESEVHKTIEVYRVAKRTHRFFDFPSLESMVSKGSISAFEAFTSLTKECEAIRKTEQDAIRAVEARSLAVSIAVRCVSRVEANVVMAKNAAEDSKREASVAEETSRGMERYSAVMDLATMASDASLQAFVHVPLCEAEIAIVKKATEETKIAEDSFQSSEEVERLSNEAVASRKRSDFERNAAVSFAEKAANLRKRTAEEIKKIVRGLTSAQAAESLDLTNRQFTDAVNLNVPGANKEPFLEACLSNEWKMPQLSHCDSPGPPPVHLISRLLGAGLLNGLILQRTGLDDAAMILIADAVVDGCVLKDLDVSFNPFGAVGGNAIARMVGRDIALENLRVCRRQRNRLLSSCESILVSLCRSETSKLKLLDLQHVVLNGAAAPNFIEENHSLTHLDLRGSQLAGNTENCASLLIKFRGLQTAVLSSCDLNDESMIGLTQWIAQSNCHVDLSHNSLRHAACSTLAQRLGAASPSCRCRVEVSHNPLGADGLRSLVLIGHRLGEEHAVCFESCELTDEAVILAVEAFEAGDHFGLLDLSSNRLTNSQAEFDRLFRSPKISQLDFSYNPLGSVGANRMMTGLWGNRTLVHLRLTKVGVNGDELHPEFWESLFAQKRILSTLVLDHNPLKCSGISALCNALGNAPCKLTCLSLCNTKCGQEGLDALRVCLVHGTGINQRMALWITDNLLEDAAIIPFFQAVFAANSRNRLIFYVRNNRITMYAVAEIVKGLVTCQLCECHWGDNTGDCLDASTIHDLLLVEFLRAEKPFSVLKRITLPSFIANPLNKELVLAHYKTLNYTSRLDQDLHRRGITGEIFSVLVHGWMLDLSSRSYLKLVTKLDLSHNPLGDRAVDSLLQILPLMKASLKVLCLKNVGFSDDGLSRVLGEVMRHHQRVKVDCSNEGRGLANALGPKSLQLIEAMLQKRQK